MSSRKPSYTRSGTLILNTPNYIGPSKPALKRKQSTRVNVSTIARPRYGISLYQSKKNSEEWKNLDTQVVDSVLGQTNAWNTPILLNIPSSGTAPNQRIGRRILMRSIAYRFHLGEADGNNLTVGIYAATTRIVIVYDRQANGVAPASTDVFQVNVFHSPLHLANSDRFLVISDRIFENPTAGAGGGPTSGQHGRKMSLETVFNTGGAGTIADINSGSLYAFIATGSTVPGPPVLNAYFRLRYTDA